MTRPPPTPPPSSPSAPTWPRRWDLSRIAVTAGAAAAGVVLAAGLAPQWPWLAAGAAALGAGLAAWWRPPAPLPVAAPVVPASEALLRDPQTGMFHRPAFLALVERDWQRAGRYGGAVALLLVEVDRLRALTDRAGAGVADHLLAGLGRQVLASLRGADLLARFDEAQLAVFLPQADATGALDVADRIRVHVEHLELPGLPAGAPITASIGVSVMRPVHQPLSTLVADAQRALQTARQAGGNCVRLAPDDALPPPGGDGSWVGDDSAPPRERDA
jgi:diguanylate cyclase